ncbi:MAG: IS66 family insertion sequence element accessory protein TnpB [Oligoflexia bacterium]|nr:IS66 family insertion sequence element accessory protein TnpB [Oligoflexia bacterium]
MFLDRKGLRIFVYREPIDMRCGFEKLHSYCVHQMKAIMDQGHVYLFFGKNRRRLKILVYDGSGLVLIAKRMERGNFMSHSELLGRNEISQQELQLILHGSIIRRPLVDRSLTASMPQRESFALPIGSQPSS